MKSLLMGLIFTCMTSPAAFASENLSNTFNFQHSIYGYLGLAVFCLAYSVVILEEKLHLRKSKPVIMAAGIIWIFVAITYATVGDTHTAHQAIQHNLQEYAELFLFLLAAMTYINAMSERNVFRALRYWLVSRGFSLRTIFWLTGLLAFLISPIADNLTTALLMGATVTAVAGNNKRFVVLAYINIVVAANAGGAFSPFGDITTLMVWQKGKIQFGEFLVLFLPALVNWLVPATIMSFFVSKEQPQASDAQSIMKFGSKRILALFLMTIATAVSFHNYLHLPPAVGMMLGLSYLGFFSYYIRYKEGVLNIADNPLDMTSHDKETFDLFRTIRKTEWDTLLFFYGVILCVGGLGQFGYLSMLSHAMYQNLGATTANILVGVISALIDNIPVMFAVLTMDPQMSHGQWRLVTLTAGVGGSLLSVGSAAGVALMGQANGIYTFGRHLVWMPVIALGYVASIYVHIVLNASLFH